VEVVDFYGEPAAGADFLSGPMIVGGLEISLRRSSPRLHDRRDLDDADRAVEVV
jgi:hypothetical protein